MSCKTWSSTIWDLTDKYRLYCSRRSTMTKKRLAKKKKIVNLDLSNDGITTQHGSTAGGRPQSGGIYTDGHIIQSISPPGTGHQSPGNRHQSSSPGTGQPVTGHQSPVIQAPVIGEQQAPIIQCQLPDTGTRQPGTWYWSPVPRHWAQVTNHQAPVIRLQMLGSE